MPWDYSVVTKKLSWDETMGFCCLVVSVCRSSLICISIIPFWSLVIVCCDAYSVCVLIDIPPLSFSEIAFWFVGDLIGIRPRGLSTISSCELSIWIL